MSEDTVKKAGRPSGSKNKKTQAGPVVAKLADPHDKKMEHFSDDKSWEYDANKTSYDWDNDSPLNVPQAIKDKYPGMTFRWRAKDDKAGTLKKGNEYHGWQKFNDPALGYGEGLSAGGDTLLCAMPTERAEAYRQHVRQQSTDLVKDSQHRQVSNMERAITEAGVEGFFPISSGLVDGREVQGIRIGASRSRNKKTGEVREQYRGEHPEVIEERTAKMLEDRAKHRVYTK